MSFPAIFRRLFQKEGAGPLLRKEIIPPHADTHGAKGGDPIDITALGGASAEELAALQQQVAKLAEAVADIKVDPWDSFPLRVPIAVDGVTFGGSDGRRAILPGEEEAREDWILCDGGGDGKGDTVPDLRDRMIMGAGTTYKTGAKGGAATHTHSVSGTVGATTLTVAQMPGHTHAWNRVGDDGTGSGIDPTIVSPNEYHSVNVNPLNATGGSQPHTHALSGASGQASSLPPYYALAYIMRIA